MKKIWIPGLLLILCFNGLAMIQLASAVRHSGITWNSNMSSAGKMVSSLKEGITVPVRLDIQKPELVMPEIPPIQVRVVPVVERPQIPAIAIPAIEVPVKLDLQMDGTLLDLIQRFRERGGLQD